MLIFADVTELVDVPDLGSGVERRVGSSPFIRTSKWFLIVSSDITKKPLIFLPLRGWCIDHRDTFSCVEINIWKFQRDIFWDLN